MTQEKPSTIVLALSKRSFAQWMVSYAVVLWFLLEFLDFLATTYEWDSRIIRSLTTLGITGFTVMATVSWFHGQKGRQEFTRLGGTLLVASLLLVFTSSWRAWDSSVGLVALLGTSLVCALTILGATLYWLKAHPEPIATDEDNVSSTPGDTPNASPSSSSIAVLPFRSLSPDPEDGFFAEGLADEILTTLAQIPDLQVASRTSSFSFRDRGDGDSKLIGTELNVSYLLDGSVRKSGERLRVSVQLTQVSDGYAIWSKTFNKTIEDIFDVQDQVAERVASALKSTLWESALSSKARNRTSNIEAYREYLIAIHYNREMHQGGSEAQDKVRFHAERAVELDQGFVPAWILLATVYLNRMGYRMPREEAHALARNALSHVLEIEPDNPEVILKLAELARGDHQYKEALALYERARALDRSAPHVDYATLLYTVGHLNLALKEFEHCISLDPENFSLWYYYASALLSKGDYPAAISNYEKSLQIAGDGFLADGVRATLAGISYLYADEAHAREIFKPCLSHNPNRIDFERGLIAGIQAVMGDRDSALEVAGELEARAKEEHVDPQALFWVYFGIDAPDRNRLFHWMDRVVDEDSFPSTYFLLTWPLLAKFREDERYQALLKKAGILDVAQQKESD
jgi:adenylate cyclase